MIHRSQERESRRDSERPQYTAVASGRRVFMVQIRSILFLSLLGCILLAMETTVLSRIPMPLLSPASPSLALLFVMAVGFCYGWGEGAVTGLTAGWLADASGGPAIMLLPALYCLLGYLSGLLGNRRLAHNMPSFWVFSFVGGLIEAIFYIVRETVFLREIPPMNWSIHHCIPALILTVLAAPVVYGLVYWEKRLFGSK